MNLSAGQCGHYNFFPTDISHEFVHLNKHLDWCNCEPTQCTFVAKFRNIYIEGTAFAYRADGKTRSLRRCWFHKEKNCVIQWSEDKKHCLHILLFKGFLLVNLKNFQMSRDLLANELLFDLNLEEYYGLDTLRLKLTTLLRVLFFIKMKNDSGIECDKTGTQGFKKKFTYVAENDFENEFFELLDHSPTSYVYQDKKTLILFGKWIVKNASKASKDVEILKKALTEFISSFEILESHEFELYAFQRIVTDCVSLKGEIVPIALVCLVEKLRLIKTTKNETCKSINDGSKLLKFGEYIFKSLSEVYSQCRILLQDSEEGVVLNPKNFLFVKDLLQKHPDANIRLSNVVSISIAFDPKKKCRRFLINTGSTTFFINHIHALLQCGDTLDIIYEVVCETICMIVTLFPRCSEDLTDLLAQKYPKLRVSIDIQLIYLKGCLYLAEHVFQLHQAILKTVLSNLTALDLEVKSTSTEYLDTNNFSEWKERQLHLLAEEVRKGSISSETIQRILSQKLWFETLFQKVRTDEDVDCMAFRLDILMAYLIKWSNQQIQNALETPIPSHLLSVLSINSGDDDDEDDDDDKNDELPTGLSDSADTCKQIKRTGLTMADVIVADLLGIFRSVVLTTEKCRYVQYYFFYITSLKSEWAEKLLQIFFSILFDPDALLSLRRLCSDYIASYVSRATFLPIKFIRSSLRYLIQFLNEFLSFWNQRDSIPNVQQKESLQFLQRLNKGKAYVNPQSRLTLFYSVFQTTCYILCFTGDALRMDSPKPSKLKDSCNAKLEDDTQVSNFLFEEVNDSLTCIMNSDLCPLIQCNPTIIRVSIETFRRLKLFSDLETEFDRVLSLIPFSHCTSLDESKIIPSLPFNPYPLWYSTYYFVPLYRTWSQINSSQNSEHFLKKNSIQCNVHQPNKNIHSPHSHTTPICDGNHNVSVEENVTKCGASSLADKADIVEKNDKSTFDPQEVEVKIQTFHEGGETINLSNDVRDFCIASKPNDLLHNDKHKSNANENSFTNSLELKNKDLVTHMPKNTKVAVETDHLSDTSKSEKNNLIKNTKQVTSNENVEKNELNALIKNKEICTLNDSSKYTLDMDVNQKNEVKSVDESNEQLMTKTSTRDIEPMDVERVDGTEKLGQTNETFTSVSVSQINNQLAKIVDAINSQIKTPCFASSVTLPTTTFNALLSAILSVTAASSSPLSPIQNSCASQLSAFDLTQGSCDHTLSPQSTTCVDSTDGESVLDNLSRNSGLNKTLFHSYDEVYYNFDKKHTQNFDHSYSTTSEKNCLDITQKKSSKYQLSRTRIQELACKKHFTRCQTSHLSLISKTNSIKKRQQGEKHHTPVVSHQKVSSSQLTTPILDLSEDYTNVKEKDSSFCKLTGGEFLIESKTGRAQDGKKGSDFSFSFNCAPFREEQILEELEPFLEWDASGFTTASTDLSKKHTRSKQKVKCGSRMLELLSSRAYRSSLKKPFDYLGDQNSVHMKSLRKKKRHKKREEKKTSYKISSNELLNNSPCDEEMVIQPFFAENIKPKSYTIMNSTLEQNARCFQNQKFLDEVACKKTHASRYISSPLYDEGERHKKRKRNKNRDKSIGDFEIHKSSSKRSKRNSILI